MPGLFHRRLDAKQLDRAGRGRGIGKAEIGQPPAGRQAIRHFEAVRRDRLFPGI